MLVIAALILHALLAPFTPAPRGAVAAAGSEAGGSPLMLQVAAQLVLPFTVLLAVFLYLRGRNQPGGGFIGGLVLAIGLLLQHVADGQAWVAQRASTDLRGWLGWGLLIAAATGAASRAFGAPFLTSTYDYPWLPGIGGVPLASASAFDLGVFVVVVGAAMVMLLSIARLSHAAGAKGG